MAEVSRQEPLELNMTRTDVMALYAGQRLADMGAIDGWLYRHYRRLSPRARMFTREMAIVLLLWLALQGCFTVALGLHRIDYLSLIGLLLGTTLRTMLRSVPFRYQ
ncbi:hypothetical protein J2Y58_002146 [Sphingomonas sp. BE138]|uniref:hypothetical protein n=1 Tax=Sphingomonas sp. BE138 TaxID=2817845 RepID=UPI0028647576|nr:hypothetical protein [Sphingomonas sp. BE138]MDR6788781.1 hypothetical protein [Sphingomonas sp. BE138]